LKVLAKDAKNRLLKLKVESEEDLWILYNLLEKEDKVYAKTTRELKKSSGSRRKPMQLGLKLEWREFQPFTTRLRVHGIIIEGPKELDLENLRHTINVDINSEITIIKDKGWNPSQLERVEEACKKTMVKGLLISIDDEKACIASIGDYGIGLLSEISLNLPGKLEPEKREEALEKRLDEIEGTIKNVLNAKNFDAIIVSGPGFIKDKLVKKMIEKYDLKDKIFKENTSYGGIAGVYETLRREVIGKVLSQCKAIEERKLMDEVLSFLGKDSTMVVFSLEEIEELARVGAIKKLLIIDEMVRAYDESLRKKIEELMKLVEEKKGEVKIFASNYDPYFQLKNFGGIVGILRFKPFNF
jgi:protein pelota